MPPRLLSTLLALLLLAAGCGEAGSPTLEESPNARTTAPSPTPSAEPWEVMDGPLSRCGPMPAAVTDNGIEARTLRDPRVGTIPAAVATSGATTPTVVVLLHQTNGNGLCGWLPFAAVLAGKDLGVLAIDLCKYGAARCTKVERETFTDADQVDAVRVAVRHARTRMHAGRVVVLGASMGGAVALMAAATLDGIDTAIDLSGPVEWRGTEVIDAGSRLQVPVLVAMAESEGADEVSGARAIVAAAPEGSRLHVADAGHGYELLLGMDDLPLPFAREVLGWITDDAP